MVKKIAALTLARDCYSLTLDLAANVDVIENTTKFIEEHKQKQKGDDNNNKSTEESSTTTTTAAEADDELKKTNEVF
jgi:hypothetical protein